MIGAFFYLKNPRKDATEGENMVHYFW